MEKLKNKVFALEESLGKSQSILTKLLEEMDLSGKTQEFVVKVL